MKKSIRKDLTSRFNYLKQIKQKIVQKTINHDRSLSPFIKRYLFYKKKNIYSSICHLNNICLITNNSNSVLKKFKMSRITFRTLIHKGLIPGVSKSS